MKNKTHTTNYYNTLITVAADCSNQMGTTPPQKTDHKTIARLQYDILTQNPYKYNSDDVLFMVFAQRNKIPGSVHVQAREAFFSKGQPCFRASPLAKKFAWGIHADKAGKVAIYGLETLQYQNILKDDSIEKVNAMRNSRK